jgi:hypothetical protein
VLKANEHQSCGGFDAHKDPKAKEIGAISAFKYIEKPGIVNK